MRVVTRWSVAAFLMLVGFAVHPDSAAAGSISIDTKFQGVITGYRIEGGFFPGVIGSVGMSNPQGLGLDPALVFEAYCVDLFTDIFDPGTSTQAVPVTVSADAASMALWSDPGGRTLNAPGAGSRAAYLYQQFAPGANGDNVKRTALQAAIWNVLYDTDASVSNGQGTFSLYCDSTAIGFAGCNPMAPTSGLVVSTANAYLSMLGAASAGDILSADAMWLKLTAPDGDIQDFVGPAAEPMTAVPEPASLLLLGSGLATLLARRRRSSAPTS